MATSSLVFILALVAGGLAAPWTAQAPRCSTECPITGSPKLAYQPEKTYTYAYSGKSRVQLKGVEDGVTELEWSKQVELTWITPCDMAITIKHAKVDGAAGADIGFLERYPLVVAVVDGRIQHVCTQPGDAPWSINMKKGIATTLQNSLPSLSPFSSGLTITETDVVGKCPTKYEIETEGEKVIVVKEKNHRQCQERFPTPAETPAPWLKAPLPIEESRSECKQEITNGIYTAIMCQDMNIVRPAFGIYKYVEANQESTLRFISESSDASAISAIPRGEFHIESLLYNHEMVKEPELAPEVDEVMKQICQKTMETVETDAAALVAKALHLLRRVPVSVVEATAEKVRGGRYCGNSARLESIFLDAIAFVHESGAVKVMVQEIESGRATGGRLALYTAALYLTPRPNIEAVEALKPLFESPRPVPSVALAAATMVNNYCRHTPHCNETAPVKEIAEILAAKVQRQCSPSAGEEVEKEALATLKALGNMGVIIPAVTRAAVGCIEQEGVETSIRVAAAHVFRHTQCAHYVTGKLSDIAVHPSMATEVRIAAYLGAIRCAEEEHLEKIISKISEEQNTQVRGFILSHLLNIQESASPDRERLRYLLTNFVIPRNFDGDIRKHSRNIEMSYFSPLGIGAGVESNVIYTPESFLPRSVDLNLRTTIEGLDISLGEAGIRLEGLDPIIKELVGPEGYLRKASFGRILKDIVAFAEEKGHRIAEHLEESLREKRAISASTISRFFKKLYGERKEGEVRADIFARIFGHEVTYATIAEDLKELDADRIIESLFSYFDAILPNIHNLDIDSARTAQIFLDYSLPTIQGTPLKLKLEGTAIVGIKLAGDLNIIELFTNPANVEKSLKLIPSASIAVSGFVGYDCHIAKVGTELKSTIATANGATINIKKNSNNVFEFELELPEKMELFSVKAETNLIKAIGKRVTKVSPPSMRDVRIHHQKCMDAFEPVFGIKMCYEMNFPDIFRSTAMPLGEPIVAKLYIEKVDPSMKGYRMTTATKNKRGNKVVKVNIETPGAATPRQAELTMSYTKEERSYIVSAKFESSSTSVGLWTTLTNEGEYKALETFIKCRSEYFDISRGMKAEFSGKEVGNEKQYEINVFTGQNKRFATSSKMVEARFIKKMNGPEVEVTCRTMNGLRDYVALNIEVDADFRYNPYACMSVPTAVRKMEFHTSIRGWKIASSVHKTAGTIEATEHIATFIVEARNTEIMSVKAAVNTRGRMFRNMIIQNEISVNFGQQSYSASYDLFLGASKMGTKVEVTKPKENLKITEFGALYERAGNTHNVKVFVNAPQYMRAIKFESKISEEENGKYAVEAALQGGQRNLLQLDGPVTYIYSPRKLKFEAELKVAMLDMEPHIISTTMLGSSSKQILAFEMKNRQESLFAFKWILTSEVGPEQKTISNTKLIVPAFMEFLFDISLIQNNIHLSLNTAVLPKSESAHRIKTFVDIDGENKKINAEFAWDADRNPDRKLVVDANLISSSSDLGHASIHGNIIIAGEPYHMKLSLNAEDILASGFELEVTTPSQKTLAMEASYKIEDQRPITRVITMFRYKNTEDKEHKFTGSVAAEKLEGPYSYALDTKVIYIAPEGKETRLETILKHHKMPEARVVLFKVNAEGLVLRKPLVVEFFIENKEGSYEGKCTMTRNAPKTVFDWDVKIHPHGEIEAIEAGLDLKATVQLLKVVRAALTFEKEDRIERSESANYRYHYSKPTPTSYHVTVQTPSRTMQGEAHISASQSGIKFYPNKRNSESTYEIGYKTTHTGNQGRWESQINHPDLPKPMQFALQYAADRTAVEGTVELDIFPSSADKITGHLASTRVSENTIRTEGSIVSRVLKVNPKLILTTAIASDTVGLDVEFKKSPSAPPSIKVIAKYDKTSPKNAVLAFTIDYENTPVFEVSGVMKPDETPTCNGLAVSAVVYTPVLGTHDIHSRMCKPAFVEVTTNKQGTDRKYIARIGLQAPDNAEVSLSKGTTQSVEEYPIILARLEMVDPTVIRVGFAYERPELYRMKDLIQEKLSNVKTSVGVAVQEIFEEVAGSSASMQGSEFSTLIAEVKEELGMIYQDLVEDSRQFLREMPSFGYIKNSFRRMIRIWAQLEKSIIQERKKMINVCLMMVKDITTQAFTALEEALEILETGEIPEPVRHMVEVLKSSEMHEFFKGPVDALLYRYPEEYEAIKYVAINMISTLERDFDLMFERIMEIPAFQRIINWIMENLNPGRLAAVEANTLAEILLEDFHVLDIKTEENQLMIEIPLYKPLYSVVQFIKEVINPYEIRKDFIWLIDSTLPYTLEDFIWMYYTFVPQQITDLLPPYPRTAMVVGGTEILTFDGLVVRAPRSPCKVLLAAHGSHTIMMSHPQPSAPAEIELKTADATIVIKPDAEVLVNGQPIRGSEETAGKIRIEKNAEEIVVQCPLMKIIVSKKSEVVAIKASGWTFGHVAGLLGPNNGEIGDDRLMPNGAEPSSLREVVASWQERKQCSMPEIPHAIPTVARVMKCEALLRIRSQCIAVVEPEPFIQMCHAAQNACDAFTAFRTFCALKGVVETSPIPC
ncbi:vitellogenin-like [Penaeus chinensis]|uniref:vitellogenin-like n=1 Tax=Penaeus chinensis TaxID=139456 RepID=UPI001FB5D529|nr:vitellogenin-like [Penaeus chinensis]